MQDFAAFENMSEKVQADSGSILCDMCTEEDRKPARKTCMKCEISMCVQHLQAHLTTPVLLQTHLLTEPMAIGGNIKCPQHGKLLEYYCLDDMTCVCVSCAIEDQHRIHNMKTFSTAHKELMEKLKAEQQVLQEKTEDENVSLEKWEQSERQKLARCSVRLLEAVTNLRDISLTTVQSSVSARMVAIRTSKSSMEAVQKEKDTFRFLQMYSQVNQDVEKAKAVDLRKGLEPGSHRDKLVQEIREKGEEITKYTSNFIESLLILVDPEHLQELSATSSDLIFKPQCVSSSMSLSINKRKVFCNSWLGQCYATLLIRSSSSSPNYQRWVVNLTQKSDWLIGLCDKQSAKNPKNGPVFGLSCEDKKLSSLTTEYDQGPDASSSSGQWIPNQGASQGKFRVHSEFLTDLDKVPRPETVEVFWNFVSCNLSFFSRAGRYQRKEIITIEASVNNWDLVPFVQLGKENDHTSYEEQWKCYCGMNSSYYQTSCSSCGKMICDMFSTEVVCEIL